MSARTLLVACEPPLLQETLLEFLGERSGLAGAEPDEVPNVVVATLPAEDWPAAARAAVAWGAQLVLVRPGGTIQELLDALSPS